MTISITSFTGKHAGTNEKHQSQISVPKKTPNTQHICNKINISGEGSKSTCVPVYVVDFVSVLALLPFFLVRFIPEDFDPLSSSRVVLTGLGNRVQLADLVLE